MISLLLAVLRAETPKLLHFCLSCHCLHCCSCPSFLKILTADKLLVNTCDLFVVEAFQLLWLYCSPVRKYVIFLYVVCIFTVRTMLSQDVRLPCLSVTHRYYITTAYVSSKFFHLQQPHHSSFSIANLVAIFHRNMGVKCTGYEKMAIFFQYLALSWK